MKRRTFIKVGIALTGAGIISYLVLPDFKAAVMRILKSETKNLKITETALGQFMADADKEQFWLKFSRSKKIMITLHAYSGFLRNLLPYRNKYLLYKSQITGHFLLSTDLFLNKMDTTQPVNYFGFYNPYKQPCYNPFAVNYYRETA